MLRFLLRALGFVILACAFAGLIVDGTRSVAANAVTVTPLGEALAALLPTKFSALQAAAQRISPYLWDPILATLMLLPTWAVAGALGALVLLASRPKRPPIGYSSR